MRIRQTSALTVISFLVPVLSLASNLVSASIILSQLISISTFRRICTSVLELDSSLISVKSERITRRIRNSSFRFLQSDSDGISKEWELPDGSSLLFIPLELPAPDRQPLAD